MQGDQLCLDMDRSSKANSKPSNGSKPVASSVQTSDRPKGNVNCKLATPRINLNLFPVSFTTDPQAYSRNPRKNKPTPQKFRSWQDKRPQARGSTTETFRGKVAYEAESGYGAFCDEQRQKKVNLNHLLNFTFNSTFANSTQNQGYYDSRASSRGSNHGKQRSTIPRYNKELYLQANCQFVVRAEGDYAVHAIDPDHPVEWDLVEQVVSNFDVNVNFKNRC